MVEKDVVARTTEVMIGHRLDQFKDATLFQSGVVTFLVRLKSNKEDLSQLRRIFTQIDTNHDGFLEQSEIEHAMKSFSSEYKSNLGEDV